MKPVISITAPTPTNFKSNVHGHIYRTTTFFTDAALFDMVRRFTSHHAELSHDQKHALWAGRNADGFHRGGRGGVGPSGAGNRRRSHVRCRREARQARDRQPGAPL